MDNEHQANTKYSLFSVCLKSGLVHTVTYFVIGFISFTVFDYSARYADPLLGNYMRQTNHPLVTAGPLFQILRGFLFGLVFYWLRDVFFNRKNGWLYMWLTLLIVGVISPFGASPSSIEGLLYTNVPLNFHIIGFPEVAVQSLLLALCTHFWVRHPEMKWLGWLFGISFFLIAIMSILGTLVGLGIFPAPAS